jgi:hypothetical protein
LQEQQAAAGSRLRELQDKMEQLQDRLRQMMALEARVAGAGAGAAAAAAAAPQPEIVIEPAGAVSDRDPLDPALRVLASSVCVLAGPSLYCRRQTLLRS